MRNNSTWVPSALSPIAWPTDAWNLPLTLIAVVGAVALNIVPAIAYVIVAVGLGAMDPKHPTASLTQLLLAQSVTYVPLLVYFAFVLPKLAKMPLRGLGFALPTSRDVGVALVGVIVMWLAVSGIGGIIEALTHHHETEAAVSLLERTKDPSQKALFLAIACVFAPLVEELEFRVFVLNALTRYVSIPISIVASGLVFGLVHSQSLPQLLSVGVPLAIGGMVLAGVYLTTRNYWSSFITHGLFNAITTIAVLFFHVK